MFGYRLGLFGRELVERCRVPFCTFRFAGSILSTFCRFWSHSDDLLYRYWFHSGLFRLGSSLVVFGLGVVVCVEGGREQLVDGDRIFRGKLLLDLFRSVSLRSSLMFRTV